jgi:hypothetical protein
VTGKFVLEGVRLSSQGVHASGWHGVVNVQVERCVAFALECRMSGWLKHLCKRITCQKNKASTGKHSEDLVITLDDLMSTTHTQIIPETPHQSKPALTSSNSNNDFIENLTILQPEPLALFTNKKKTVIQEQTHFKSS